MEKKNTNWWQVILVLLIGAGAIDGFMWYLYNTYVPLYLQGGNPNFQAEVLGFGLTPKVVGIILVIDNIVAFLLAPVIGAWSDGYRGRFGRRMPFIVATVPLAAIALAIVPFVYKGITVGTSGNLSVLLPLFIPFFILLMLIIIPLAVARTPVDALVYDLAPSQDRTKARSLGVIVATFLSVVLSILASILYEINIIYPFLLSFVVTIGLLVLGVFTIKEKKGSEINQENAVSDEQKETGIKRTISIVRSFPSANKKSILYMFINIFFGTFGFSIIQAFLSSYNMTVMGASEAKAGIPFMVAGITMAILAFPAALLANKISRRRTMMIGCVGWAVFAIIIFLLKSPSLFIPLMAVVAAFFSLWYINGFVTLIDAAPDDKTIGTMTALTGMANMAGMSIGPALTGFVIEAAGYDYNVIFIVQPVVAILAFLALLPVVTGEMRIANKSM